MLNGIYLVTFSSTAANRREQGLAVFKSGSINGGDTGYIYRGTYTLSARLVIAQIHVSRWKQTARSLFGNIPEYALELSGTVSDDGNSFKANGKVLDRPQLVIEISGQKLSDAA